MYYVKIENLKEMGNFLDTYHEQKLNQDCMSNLKKSIAPYEISLPTKKGPGLDCFRTEFYQTFKELMPMLLRLFYKIETE